MWLSYLDPLLRQGAIKPLTPLDLGGPAKEDKAEVRAGWRAGANRQQYIAHYYN